VESDATVCKVLVCVDQSRRNHLPRSFCSRVTDLKSVWMAFITQEGKAEEPVFNGNEKGGDGDIAALVARVELPTSMLFGVTDTSQSTLLLKKKKETNEIDEALAQMKDEFRLRMEACGIREEEIKRKEEEMKDQVTKFQKFLRENDAKRARAESKAKTEVKLRVQHEKSLRLLLQQLRQMNLEREALKRELDHLEKYHVFLDSVVEVSEGEYEEIVDLLNRYKTLAQTNKDLTVSVKEHEAEMDGIRSQLNQLKQETQNQLLVKNSAIHTKQKTLESLRAASMKKYNERDVGERITKDFRRESGQVLASIKNLHARCLESSKRERVKLIHQNETIDIERLSKHLKTIQHRILDLSDVYEKSITSQ